MEWKFIPMGDEESRDGSNLAEFFRTGDVFKDFTDGLVREDVQNRLDARIPDLDEQYPVIVRYYLSENDADSKSKIDKWLMPLKEHCNSKQCCDTYFRKPLKCFDKPLRYLTIECFNTTGLKGDPNQCNENAEDINTNDFYWMFRNVGRSGKKRLKGKRGSWGVGKVVYHLASEANAIFCYTRTSDHVALMGKAQLEPHMIGNTMYRSVGYFGNYRKSLALPEMDAENPEVQEFCKDFGIERKEVETGTSTIIPFCHKDIKVDKLVISSIRSYLWELLKGHVVIEIASNTMQDAPVVLNNDVEFIKAYIDKYFPDEVDPRKSEKAKFLAFADFYNAIIQSQRGETEIKKFTLNDPGSYINVFDYKKRMGSDVDYQAAKEAYLNNEIVEIDAKVTIGKKTEDGGEETIPATVQVFLQRGLVETPLVSLIRDGLTILKLDGHRRSPFCALTLIEKNGAEENPLSDFVRAAESPSHTDLKPSREAFSNVYSHGSVSLIKYIMGLMWELSAAFTDVAGVDVEDAFDNLFDMDGDDSDGQNADEADAGDGNAKGKGKKKGKKKKKVKPVVPPLAKKNTFYRLAKWNYGVKVVQSDTPATQEDLPWHLQLKMAYAQEDLTNPFKRYDLSDFDCRADDENSAKIKADCVGCEVVKRDPNRMVFKVSSPEFSIQLTGFETKQDIVVDSRKIKVAEVEEEPADVVDMSEVDDGEVEE